MTKILYANKSNSSDAFHKQQKNKNIQKVLSKASCSNEVISYTASLVCKHHESTNAKETIHQALCDKFGDGRGLNIYNHIKKYI